MIILFIRASCLSSFWNARMPYNEKLRLFALYGKISILGNSLLTSLSIDLALFTSVWYFPVQPPLSVSKLLIIKKNITRRFEDMNLSSPGTMASLTSRQPANEITNRHCKRTVFSKQQNLIITRTNDWSCLNKERSGHRQVLFIHNELLFHSFFAKTRVFKNTFCEFLAKNTQEYKAFYSGININFLSHHFLNFRKLNIICANVWVLKRLFRTF